MSRDRIEDIYPLSPMQQGMLFHCLLSPGLYVEQLRCGLEGDVEPTLLKRAWQLILDRQPALRTAFAWERRNEPLQVVFRQVDLPWTELDWTDLDFAEVDDRFAAFCREEATRPFDLARAPLLRVALIRCGGGAWRFAWTYHHLILDRWSSTRVMDELMIAYAAFRGGAQPELPSAPPFRDYIAWLGKQDPQAAESFWRAELAELRVPTPLPLDRSPGRRSEGGRRFRALVADPSVEELRAGALAFSGTLATIAQAAWGLLLSRYGGGSEVVFGTTVSGRPPTLDRVESMVGLMINTLPVRLPIDGPSRVADWLRNLFRRQVATREFEFTPLLRIQRWVGLAQGTSLFESLLVFENTPPSTARPGAQAMRVIAVDSSQATNFPLMAVLGMDTALSIEINFDGERFDDSDVARLGRHLEALMLGLVRGMDSTVDAVPMLSPSERQELLGGRTVRRDAPLAAPSLHAAVLALAARQPDALAVAYGGESLSYGALAGNARALAEKLGRLGVEPGDKVGLCCERSIEMIVAILGTLTAGAAYVPMDPASPRSRLNFQLEDSGVPVVLVHPPALSDRFDAAGRRVVALADEPATPAEPPKSRRESLPEDAAYVIYTSGSTGRPKGVVVDHRAALRLFFATEEWFEFGAADVWTLFHSYAFDFSVWEIFGALLFGGKLVVVPYETSRSPEAFHQLLRCERATVLNQTPSAFRTLDAADAGRGGEEASALALSVVVFAGEVLDPRSLAGWFGRHGERTRMVNMYGITETTVHVTYRPILPADASSAPGSPIGVPITDLDLYLVDLAGSLEPLPIGAPGEILVGGPGLAQGYLGRPELTAERFVPHPFRGAGERLYRSGDLARLTADGELEVLGRIDQQVKIRGFRIELGEIEAVAASHRQVDGAAVVALSGPSGDPRLVLYVASADPPSWPELRTYLSARLPDYMVPSIQVAIPSLPLTVNGKVDRRGLPAPEPARPDLGHGAVSPRSQIEERIAAIWRAILGLETIGVFDNFFDLGATSLDLIRALGQLRGAGESLAHLEMIDLFRFPNVDSLARHLTGEAEPAAEASPAPNEPAFPAGGADNRIAIIGMACRFPGATSPDELWTNLVGAVESISFFGADELAVAGVSEAILAAPNFVRAKGVIADADLFDAAFFGFNPREAEITDPQHRTFLECVWEALENAGYDPFGRRIGLYCGSSKSGYWLHVLSRGEIVGAVGEYAISIANDKDYLATKASYKLNLRGPSVTVQTACSTSLVATHLACRSLLMGECDLALAGGVSIDPVAKGGYFYEEGGIASRDGHCRAFDARSGGTVPGNGAGVVVLKRLADAERDGDPIYAVILGTAINNDGSDKVGYTAPSVAGQAAVIAEAQRAAGVAPASISYVEAHGTGTLLGDPIEVAALQQVFGRQGDGGCALGSIKTNIGHLDAAAGVAGLMKASLSLWRESIPASLHFEEPNPALSLAGSPFYVNARLREWPRGGTPRRAGVSSFGIGGTNAHAVLEEAPLAEPSEIRREWVVLPLSGRSEEAVESSVKRLARHLERHDEDALAEVGWTLQTGRRAFGHRRALVARSRREALRCLGDGAELLRGEWPGERSREVVFAFPGQGVQRFGLGRTLYEKEEAFRAALDESASLLAQELGWDVREAWFGAADSGEGSEAESSRLLSRTAVTQPALFAWEYALACQWRSWGVSPVGLVGHSLGEYVAAVVSGVMTLEEGARLVALRGRLMGELPEGGMLALAVGEEEVTSVLGEGLSLAAVNAPRRVVVSGPRDLLSSWWSSQSSRGWEGRYLETSHAFHSGMLEPILGRYARELSKVRLRAPQIPMVSNVTGDWLREDEAKDVGHWVRQLRDCVRFGSSVTALMGTGDRLLLEVGPGRTLSRLARQQEGGRGWQAVGGLTGKEIGGEEAELQRSLAQVWAHGVAVDWPSLHRGEKLRRVHLPTYPFERHRFWVEGRPFAIAVTPTDGRIDGDPGRWCYAPFWRPTVAPAADPAVADGPWLALVDREERSVKALLAALKNRGIEIVAVDRTSLDLPEGWRAGLARRLKDLAAAGRAPRRILHLWSLGASGPSDPASLSRENTEGLFALFEILRALTRELSGREIGLDVVTSGALAIESGAEVRPERAALIGPARIFRQESVEIASRLIDVDLPGENERERWADQVAAELASPARQALVGLRRGRRFELGFDPLPLLPSSGQPRLLRRQGVYLITGAFGGVGRVLARELVRSAQARLLLCGTVALPPRRDWATSLETGAPSVVDRLRFVAELEAAGGEVETFVGDASQPAFARAVVELAIARFGALHGIVHAAGIAGDGAYLPAAETDARACEVQLAPKALAMLHLADAVRERDLDFVLLCSSLATVLGGLGFAAYAAANHALEAIGEREDALGATRWISVAWDGWQLGNGGEVGPGLDPSSGAECFRRILDHGAGGTIVVSTSDLGARLRRSVPIVSKAPETPGGAPGNAAATAAEGDPEERILLLFRALLGVERIRASDDFFALGGDSLLATQLASRLRRDFAVELPLRVIFEQPTPAGLARRVAVALEGADRLDDEPISAVERSGPMPLSFAQRRLWFLDQIEPGNSAFNLSIAVRASGLLRADLLARALSETVRRHESLRTVFVKLAGEPRQVIHPYGPRLLAVDLAALDPRIREPLAVLLAGRDVRQPFDLASGPLLRATLVELDGRERLLALSMHHIVSDGWSLKILFQELVALYTAFASGEASPLPEPTIQYADFAEWQRRTLGTDRLAREVEYWQERLAGAAFDLDLAERQGARAAGAQPAAGDSFVVPTELAARLRSLAQGEGVTLFVVSTAAFAVVLRHLSGREDLLIGTDVAGRDRLETEGIIGFFINQIVLRADLAGDPTFRELLARLRDVVLAAFAHQELPFEKLVEALRIERHSDRAPLFQAKVNFQNAPESAIELPGLKFQRLPVAGGVAQLDVILNVVESDGVLTVTLEYRRDVLTSSGAARILKAYEAVLDAVVADPATSIGDFDRLLGDLDRDRSAREAARFSGEMADRLVARRRGPVTVGSRDGGGE